MGKEKLSGIEKVLAVRDMEYDLNSAFNRLEHLLFLKGNPYFDFGDQIMLIAEDKTLNEFFKAYQAVFNDVLPKLAEFQSVLALKRGEYLAALDDEEVDIVLKNN